MKRLICMLIPIIFGIGLIAFADTVENKRKWPVLRGPYLGQEIPGMEPEIFAPGLISLPDRYEINSVFTADGKYFYFVVSASSAAEKAKGIYFYYMMGTWIEKGVWLQPRRLDIAGKYSVADIALSPDGKRLYFCSEKPVRGRKPNGFNIWYVERRGSGFSAPIHGGDKINSQEGETQPSFTDDGTIYFPSRRGRTDDSQDIFFARFADGQFQQPVRLPEQINSKYGDGNAFVAPDESFLIFARWGMPKSIYGGKGMYISFRRKDGSWTEAVNTLTRTKLYGSLAALSHDRKYLLYSGKKDIYWVDIRVIDRLKPKDL